MKKLKPIPNDVFKRLVLLEIKANSIFNMFFKLSFNLIMYLILFSFLVFSEKEFILVLIILLIGLLIIFIIVVLKMGRIPKRIQKLMEYNKGCFLKLK